MNDVSFWQDRNTLVTGGTGFLGWWLTSQLVANGANVTSLVRDIFPKSPSYLDSFDKKVSVVHGSLEDKGVIDRAINEYEIDTVFHLAAQAIVGVANQSPISTFETNIKGTWLLLEACRNTPHVTRVVVASSDKAYGNHELLPYDESFALRGNYPYDVSKSCADLIAFSYYNTYSLPVCVTRCCNLFGPGDLHFSRIIPGSMKSIINNQNPIIRSDGSPLRDFIFVKDIVNAYITLAEHMDDDSIHGSAFNFGTGEPVSALSLVQNILKVAGRTDLTPDIQNTVGGEVVHQYLSSERANTLLNWKPGASLLDRLAETYQWYQQLLSVRSQEK